MIETEVVIVGAGQAGLSVARYLKDRGVSFVVLERNSDIGMSWSNRYDSLTLDSYAQYSHLDGFPFPGNQKRQPSKDEVADYLRSFARAFGLHPHFETSVEKITQSGDVFTVHTNKKTYLARSVVIATGPFSKPNTPNTDGIPETVFTIHSMDYKNPAQLSEGAALVVGAGNSGVEIAKELSDAGRLVLFSYRGPLSSVKSTPLSQWLAYRLGLAHVPKNTLLGKLIETYTKGRPVGVDVAGMMKDMNIRHVGRYARVEDGMVVTETMEFDIPPNIIWATGYISDFSVIATLGFDPTKTHRTETNIPGLYVMNMRWQWSKSSSHLAGVSRDAKFTANALAKFLKK